MENTDAPNLLYLQHWKQKRFAPEDTKSCDSSATTLLLLTLLEITFNIHSCVLFTNGNNCLIGNNLTLMKSRAVSAMAGHGAS